MVEISCGSKLNKELSLSNCKLALMMWGSSKKKGNIRVVEVERNGVWKPLLPNNWFQFLLKHITQPLFSSKYNFYFLVKINAPNQQYQTIPATWFTHDAQEYQSSRLHS